jgi:hypothetical protein
MGDTEGVPVGAVVRRDDDGGMAGTAVGEFVGVTVRRNKDGVAVGAAG